MAYFSYGSLRGFGAFGGDIVLGGGWLNVSGQIASIKKAADDGMVDQAQALLSDLQARVSYYTDDPNIDAANALISDASTYITNALPRANDAATATQANWAKTQATNAAFDTTQAPAAIAAEQAALRLAAEHPTIYGAYGDKVLGTDLTNKALDTEKTIKNAVSDYWWVAPAAGVGLLLLMSFAKGRGSRASNPRGRRTYDPPRYARRGRFS